VIVVRPVLFSEVIVNAIHRLSLVLVVSLLANAPSAASDCPKSCPDPAPSPECDGVSIQVETTCSSTRCTITIKANGNGGSDSTTESAAPTSTEAFDLCIGAPPRCITVFPCGDPGTWASAASSCAALCVECS